MREHTLVCFNAQARGRSLIHADAGSYSVAAPNDGHYVESTSQNDSTLLTWKSTLLKFDLLDVLSRDDYKADITAVP